MTDLRLITDTDLRHHMMSEMITALPPIPNRTSISGKAADAIGTMLSVSAEMVPRSKRPCRP